MGNIMKPKIQTEKHNVYDTKIFSDFFADAISAENDGKEFLYISESNNKKKTFKLIRCDSKASIQVDRIVDGKEYLAWQKVISSTAKEKTEMYFSMNSFYGERRTERLHSLQNCWVDIDNHDRPVAFETAKMFCRDLIWRLRHDDIPIPYCVFTGRGIHLFWPIFNCNKKSLSVWSCVQKGLVAYVQNVVEELDYMTGWNADKNVLDATRIMRVPGTYNQSARTWTRFITEEHDGPSEMEDFCDALGITEEDKKREKRALRFQPKENIKVSEEDLSAAEQRLLGLLEFIRGRDMNIEGKRNIFTTILASTLAVIDPTTAIQKTVDICKELKPAQSAAEIRATASCCLRNQYKWRNETIADRLGMTDEEYSRFTKFHVKSARLSVLKKGVKNRARNEAREKRRKEKEALYAKIPVLIVKGFSYSEIAKQLGIGLSTVKRHAKALLASSRNTLVKKYRIKKIKETVANIRAGRIPVCLFSGSERETVATFTVSCSFNERIFLDKSVSKRCVNKYSIGILFQRHLEERIKEAFLAV